MKPSRAIQIAAFGLAIAVYAAARFWNLTETCLWFDEIFSVHAAEHSWGTILNFISLDLIHPPLFYILLKLWIGIGGDGLLWLRLLPVGFSLLAIFPFIALCRELKLGIWTQILALLLLAINGSLIKYAQEVRMYSLLMCLSLFSMWLFVRHLNRGKGFVALLLVNVLLVYTHYFGWLVVLSEVTAILWFQRIKWRRITTMLGIVFAAFLPWMIAVVQAARSGSDLGQNIGWMTRPGFSEVSVFIFDLIEPFYYQASSAEPASVYRVTVPVLVVLLIVLSVSFTKRKGRDEVERRRGKLIVLFIGLPITLALIASWITPYSIWGTRHLTAVFAPVAILLVIALSALSQQLRVVVLTLLVLFSGYAFSLQASRPVSQFSWCVLENLIGPDELERASKVYAVEDLFAYHLWFEHRSEASALTVLKLKNVSGVAEDHAYFLPRGFSQVSSVDIGEVSDERFWLVFRGSGLEEVLLRTFIEKGYRVVEQRERAAASERVHLTLVER